MITDPLAKRLSILVVVSALGVAAAALAEERRGPPRGEPPTPPPEAYSACTSAAEGEACTVTLRDRTIDGICVLDKDDELFCRPDHPPGPPPSR